MLLLSFTIHLENYEIDKLVRPNGVLFHQWLPNGRKNLIKLPVRDSRNSIEIWFNRRGYVDKSGFIRFDRKQKKVDIGAMKRQGKLDAGQLWGQARFVHVSQTEMDAIKDDRVESEEYILVAKRIIQFLYPPLRNFINLLRFQYGQYWVPELNKWDSRRESLGSYCSTTLWLSWSENNGKSWKRFKPTDLSQTIKVEGLPGRGFAEYITKKDWNRIKKSFDPYQDTPIALTVLGRAHELSDTGNIRESFIQGVTALELAIDTYTKKIFSNNHETEKLLNHFESMPLKLKTLIIAKMVQSLPDDIIDKALSAIDIRNAIVHEGKHPDYQEKKNFSALLECTAIFIGLDEFKVPILFPGNHLSPP
jgi:hypothetical protein